MSNIIQINNLNKSFESVNAVQNLSFRVKKGELFAFLGINGAGKSTTINIMCGQLSKDSGSVFIDEHDLDKDMDYIKRELGVVFQSSVLDSALSVYDNLEKQNNQTTTSNFPCNFNFTVSNMNRFNQGIDHG